MNCAENICFIPADIEIWSNDQVRLVGKGFTSHDMFDTDIPVDVMDFYERV